MKALAGQHLRQRPERLGDVGDKTGDDMNVAVKATLEFVGVETGLGKLSWDFDTRDKAS